MALTSMCLRTCSAEVLRTVVSWSRRPALESRTSTLLILCLDLSSSTAASASVSDVASILTIISLLSSPALTSLRALVDFSTSRTAAMTVVLGRAMRASVRPFPIPRFAPVIA